MNAKDQLDKVRFFSQQMMCKLTDKDFYETMESEDTAIKLKAEDVVEDIKELVLMRERLSRQIDRLSKPEYIYVLRFRYFSNYSWQMIANQMHYAKRYIFSIHNHALDELDQIIKEDLKNAG